MISMVPPRDTGELFIVIAEFVNEEFGMLLSVLLNPLIVLLESVTTLLNPTSGLVHSSPVVVPEFAVKTLPFVPTARTLTVDAEEALMMAPFAVKTALPIVSILLICSCRSLIVYATDGLTKFEGFVSFMSKSYDP